MVRRPRPPIKRKKPGRIYIVPFSIDSIKPDGDLFRFLVPSPMTLRTVLVKIDKMDCESLELNGGLQTTDRKFSISKPVKLGINTFRIDLPVSEGDLLIIDFGDRTLASQKASGITISIYAVR